MQVKWFCRWDSGEKPVIDIFCKCYKRCIIINILHIHRRSCGQFWWIIISKGLKVKKMSWCTILGPWSLQCCCGEVCDAPGCVEYVNVPRGELGLPYLVRRSSLPSSATVCAVFLCVQTMVWLPVFEIFNVRTDVDACDCTRGLCGHRKRVCTGSWLLWEINPLPHRGLEPASGFSVVTLCHWFSVALRPQNPPGLSGTGSPGRPPRLSRSSRIHITLLSHLIKLLTSALPAELSSALRAEQFCSSGPRSMNECCY